jgi:hypothetical protein
MEFYSVSAQIIIVLLLALTIESKLKTANNVHPSALEKMLMRQNGIAIYLWACIGLLVSMLRLSDFSLWALQGGRVAVIFSISIMLIYLGLVIFLGQNDSAKTRTAAQLVLALSLAVAPLTLGLLFDPIVGYPFLLEDADAVILSIAFPLTAIPIWIALFKYRRNLARFL